LTLALACDTSWENEARFLKASSGDSQRSQFASNQQRGTKAAFAAHYACNVGVHVCLTTEQELQRTRCSQSSLNDVWGILVAIYEVLGRQGNKCLYFPNDRQ
jgi:hypothetical protein